VILGRFKVGLLEERILSGYAGGIVTRGILLAAVMVGSVEEVTEAMDWREEGGIGIAAGFELLPLGREDFSRQHGR
jgi:hypothetical protein